MAKATQGKKNEELPEKPQDELVEAPAAESPPIEEDRIDEFAIGQFKAIGHEGRLPDATVALYNEFKLRKDRQVPGRLSAEGFAFVDILADVVGGRFVLPEA